MDHDLYEVCRFADESQGLFRAAAILFPSGKVYEGQTHMHAIDAAHAAGERKEGWEHGFTGHDGRFYNRDEATEMVRRGTYGPRGGVTSEGLRKRGMMPQLSDEDRHALSGQSAVCDKRVARPLEDRDLDEVLEHADRHGAGISAWSRSWRDSNLSDDMSKALGVKRGQITRELKQAPRFEGDLLRGEVRESLPKKGTVVDLDKPRSATTRQDIAENFAGMNNTELHPSVKRILWRIRNGKGADIRNDPDRIFKSEQEVVLPAGSRMLVRKVTQGTHPTDPPHHIIEAEQLYRDIEELDRHDQEGDIGIWSEGRYRPSPDDERIDDEIRRQPKHRGKLWRGEAGLTMPEVGSTHSWGRMVSASKDRNVPIDEDFVQRGMNKRGYHPLLWEIEDGEGHDISNHPEHQYPDQREVVIPHDAKLQVNGIRWAGKWKAPHVPDMNDPDGYWHVRARQIHEPRPKLGTFGEMMDGGPNPPTPQQSDRDSIPPWRR